MEPLERVRIAAAEKGTVTAELMIVNRNLATEIREAHKAGLPLRDIAKAASVSHETVRRICS